MVAEVDMTPEEKVVWFLKTIHPELTPEELLDKFHEHMLTLVQSGFAIALLKTNGNIQYKAAEHCNDDELARGIPAERYLEVINN